MPQKPPNYVLLTPGETSALKNDPARRALILAKSKAGLNYKPAPSEVLNPDPHYTSKGVNTSANNAKSLSDDAGAAYRAAAHYLVSGDARFAACTQRILDSWAGTLKKVTTQQGRANINFNLPYMVIAASWVKGVAGWDSRAFDSFLTTIILPQSEAEHPNNQGLWGVLLESAIGSYLGDERLLSAAKKRWAARINQSVNADGIFSNEIQRSNTNNYTGGSTKGIKGMAYTHFAMLPASLAAKIFADAGQTVWNTREGKLLQAAFAHIAAWTRHPETFPYFTSNDGKLEGVRNAAYFPLLLTVYPNTDAEAVLKQGNVGMNGFLLLEFFGHG